MLDDLHEVAIDTTSAIADKRIITFFIVYTLFFVRAKLINNKDHSFLVKITLKFASFNNVYYDKEKQILSK